MFTRFLLAMSLLAAVASVPTQARAQDYSHADAKPAPATESRSVCPWLTQGSAANALGGDVSATIAVSNSGEGFCRFSRPQAPHNSLEILVGKGLSACPAGSPVVRAIGNEATRCRLSGPKGQLAEMMSSRVRDLHFTVTLTLTAQKTLVKSPDPQEDQLEQIAEQVAGNLY